MLNVLGATAHVVRFRPNGLATSCSSLVKFSSCQNLKQNQDGDKLPLPNLHQTLKKYLKYAKPFLDEQALASTQKAVHEFSAPGDLGEKLQLILEERYRNTLNWQFDIFRNMTYLERRLPLPFYTTPTGQLLYQDWTPENQLSNAAGYIRGLARAQYILEDDSTSYVEWDGRKLDKKLWRQCFNNYHFPSKPMDYVVHYGYLNPKPSHFIVAYKKMFFRLEVRGKDGLTLSKKSIESQLHQISRIAEIAEEAPVGILTWLPRDHWADAYNMLRKDKLNCKSLEVIQKAGLVICIDDEVPSDILVPNVHNGQLELGIHGGGPKYNAANRWFDKLEFVIHKKNGFGINLEHSVLDGFPCMWIMFTAEDVMLRNDTNLDSTDTNPPEPQLLKFSVDSDVQAAISAATELSAKMTQETDVIMVDIPELGVDDVKALKISPNGFCQMAQQLAYFRINNFKMDHVEEAAGLLHFNHGRTEAIRCSSQESIDFCKAMCSSKTSSSFERQKLLQKALEVHKQEMKEVMMGQGLDNHLSFLYKFAVDRGLEKHPFFEDQTFGDMFKYRLTGTQVSDMPKFACGMGPWFEDTTCTLYFAGKKRFHYTACKRKSSDNWSSADLTEMFKNSMLELWNLVKRS